MVLLQDRPPTKWSKMPTSTETPVRSSLIFLILVRTSTGGGGVVENIVNKKSNFWKVGGNTI